MDSNDKSRDIILSTLSRLENMLANNKKVLTCDDLSLYTGYAKSTIYKLVHRGQIPFSKPTGKQLFFSKEKIDEWLMNKSVRSQVEIGATARSRALLK